MDSSTKNLLFLLSLASMSIGACGGTSNDDGSDEETSSGDGDGDGDATTGDGDGDPTTGDGDGDPTTGDGDGDPTTGDGDGDPTTGDGDGDGDPNSVCAAIGELNTDCYGADYGMDAYTYCIETLEYNAMAHGLECVAALEANYACVSALTCEELPNEDELCSEELAAVEDACFGG